MSLKGFSKIILSTAGALSISLSSFATTLKIGITAGPQVEVMKVAKELAKKKYNLDLDIRTFTDYQQPNEALNAGDIDANIFQTVSFLNVAIKNRNYKLSIVGNTFIYPMGIYSAKIKKLADLKDGAVIAIPNDPSNQGRALLLLSHNQLITLKPGVGETPTPQDIVDNPKKLKITPMDASQIARVVKYDADAAAINNDFVKNAGFHYTDALVRENPATAKPYINVIVVRTSEIQKKEFQELKAVMNSSEILKVSEKLFPGAVKAW
jgi:D-methionine transport system substrate-binding protein